MKPVQTAHSNMVYRGADPSVMDLHCERLRPGLIRSVWYLEPAEREAIAKGANIALDVLTEPIPPMLVSVVEEPGVGEDAPDLLERLRHWAASQ